mmetsp:Transcript_11157/g.15352  ORF Transcript_11157/g.15352 Transcript_11157/m.15352 type:complete len:119 (+) Transcript_11157:997-1353(+)
MNFFEEPVDFNDGSLHIENYWVNEELSEMINATGKSDVLGIEPYPECAWNPHLNAMHSKLSNKLSILRRLRVHSGSVSALDTSVSCLVASTMCSSYLTYGAELMLLEKGSPYLDRVWA